MEGSQAACGLYAIKIDSLATLHKQEGLVREREGEGEGKGGRERLSHGM